MQVSWSIYLQNILCFWINPKLEKEKAKQDLEAKKAAEQKKKEELAELFKPIQAAQKIPFGTDPKTVLCQYFKAGSCEKGTKCKVSWRHSWWRRDWNIEILKKKLGWCIGLNSSLMIWMWSVKPPRRIFIPILGMTSKKVTFEAGKGDSICLAT